MRRIATVTSLFLLALALGVSFSHLLQAAPKATLPAADFLTIHQVLLSRYGLGVGLVESLALVATAAMSFLVRHEAQRFRLTVVAGACVLVMIVIWAVWINPINAQVNAWSVTTIPDDWGEARDSWHRLHTVRFALAAIAFVALSWATVQFDQQ